MILALVKSNVKVFDKIQQQQQRWSNVKQLLSLSICIVSGQWPGNPLLLPLSWQPPVLLLHEQRDDIMTMASAQCLGLASGHDIPGNLAMSRSGPATALSWQKQLCSWWSVSVMKWHEVRHWAWLPASHGPQPMDGKLYVNSQILNHTANNIANPRMYLNWSWGSVNIS